MKKKIKIKINKPHIIKLNQYNLYILQYILFNEYLLLFIYHSMNTFIFIKLDFQI